MVIEKDEIIQGGNTLQQCLSKSKHSIKVGNL